MRDNRHKSKLSSNLKLFLVLLQLSSVRVHGRESLFRFRIGSSAVGRNQRVEHVAPPLPFSRALPRNVGNHLFDFFRNLESGKVVDRKRYDRRFHRKSFVRIHSKWKKGLMVNLLFIPLIVKCEEFFFYTDVCRSLQNWRFFCWK